MKVLIGVENHQLEKWIVFLAILIVLDTPPSAVAGHFLGSEEEPERDSLNSSHLIPRLSTWLIVKAECFTSILFTMSEPRRERQFPPSIYKYWTRLMEHFGSGNGRVHAR
jgi:hypothetical protein